MSKPMDRAAFIKNEGRRWARMSREPLKKQHTSDAWNERQNRLASARTAVDMLMMGVMLANMEKAEDEDK